MTSAIIINLDYQRHGETLCHRVWNDIATAMEEAGFARHYRLFLAEMDRDEASACARRIVADVEERLAAEGIHAFDVVREFYWFEYHQANDLLAPLHEIPEVSFVDTGAFQAFFSPGTT